MIHEVSTRSVGIIDVAVNRLISITGWSGEGGARY